jgi:hypothetical protein
MGAGAAQQVRANSLANQTFANPAPHRAERSRVHPFAFARLRMAVSEGCAGGKREEPWTADGAHVVDRLRRGPQDCATGHPSPPGALGLAASDSFCRDRPALTCATSLSLARKLTQ